MKRTKILPILAFSAGMLLSGCSDFLDSENRSSVESEDYFKTEVGFENLSSTPYYKLRAIYGGAPNMFCSGTDLYESGRSGYSSPTLSTYKNIRVDDSDVLNFYKYCYDGIQQCNTVISYGKGGAAGKNVALRMEEAKVLKAFYYYLLSQQIGGVPVSDDYIASAQTSFPRKSQKEVYDFIIGLLTEVENNNILPADDNTGRVSMRFVYNLFAKTYLAYGWDFGVADAGGTGLAEGQAANVTDRTYFEKAASYADKAIGGKVPSLPFNDMWDVANDNNADIIFAIQYTRGIPGQDETDSGNQQQAQFGNYYGGTVKYTNSQFPASEKLIYLFEPDDVRYEGTFMVEHQDVYNDYYDPAKKGKTSILYYFPAWYEDLSNPVSYCNIDENHNMASIYSSSNPSVVVTTTINKRTGKITHSAKKEQSYATSRTGNNQSFCVRKFDDYTAEKIGTQAVSFHNIVLAHLTETYLMAAEAYYMAGNAPKSLARFNEVRKRANAMTLTSYSDYVRHYSDGTNNSYNRGTGIGNVPKLTGADLDPIDIILDERARELCGEYYRWMDLRRTKRLIDYNVKYNSGVTSADDFKGAGDGQYRWFRPFPQDEINLNDAITDDEQNPGYKSGTENSDEE